LGNTLWREDVGERQTAVLKELAPQEAHLLAERSLVAIPHPGLSGVMEWLSTSTFSGEGLFAYVVCTSRLEEIYAPFACQADAR
jgi:hypothetical protein